MEINIFEQYVKEPCALSIAQMQAIHQELVEEIEKDADAMELYDELVSTVTRYAAIRAGWQQLPREEKMECDPFRTSCHNSVITHFNKA